MMTFAIISIPMYIFIAFLMIGIDLKLRKYQGNGVDLPICLIWIFWPLTFTVYLGKVIGILILKSHEYIKKQELTL